MRPRKNVRYLQNGTKFTVEAMRSLRTTERKRFFESVRFGLVSKPNHHDVFGLVRFDLALARSGRGWHGSEIRLGSAEW